MVTTSPGQLEALGGTEIITDGSLPASAVSWILITCYSGFGARNVVSLESGTVEFSFLRGRQFLEGEFYAAPTVFCLFIFTHYQHLTFE